MVKVDDSLPGWSTISGQFKGVDQLGLLLGNGASQAIWSDFKYQSLYDFARDPKCSCPLTPVDQKFFDEMGTTNFEAVLSALATARMVCRHLKKPHTEIDDRYNSIRESLIHAVRSIHIAFDDFPKPSREYLAKLLTKYRYVYSTNYDLLLYWSMMTLPVDTFKDFLWTNDNMFDSSNSNEWEGDYTRVLYLHGALHLWHDLDGVTRKMTNDDDDGSIFDQFDNHDDHIPLFISEGSSKDKLRSIRRNDYLSFAYWKLAYHRGPMVIFGSELDPQFDKHIIDAINNWYSYDRVRLGPSPPKREVAFSIYPKIGSAQIIATKNRLISELKSCHVSYFDSTTHPLGEDKMRITKAP